MTDRELLHDCAALALRAYEEQQSAKDGVRAFEVFGDAGRGARFVEERALVTRVRDTLAVAIKGTDSASNWVSNVDTEWEGSVHRGFLRANDRLIATGLLEPLCRQSDQVLAIGHSKGGAQATLLARELLRRGLRVRLVTFGAPKAGGQELAKELDEYRRNGALTVDRVVHRLDPVPRLPADPAFCHPFDRPIAVDGDSRIATVATAIEDSVDLTARNDSLLSGMKDVGHRLVRFHGLHDYLACLRPSSEATPPADRSGDGLDGIARVASASMRALAVFSSKLAANAGQSASASSSQAVVPRRRRSEAEEAQREQF